MSRNKAARKSSRINLSGYRSINAQNCIKIKTLAWPSSRDATSNKRKIAHLRAIRPSPISSPQLARKNGGAKAPPLVIFEILR
jgi:hypothetical protein